MIGYHIRAARRARKLSQRQLAERIGVNRCTVGDWERERQQPSHPLLRALCQALDVSADWLLFGPETGLLIEKLECDRVSWRDLVDYERGPLEPDELEAAANKLLRRHLRER